MIHVKWLGVAGLEFTYNGYTWLVDPYLSRSGKKEVFFKRPVINSVAIDNYLKHLKGKLSAIIIGHSHLDHAMDTPELSKRFDGPVIGCSSLDALVEIYGQKGRVTTVNGNETIRLPGGADVTMIPSKHGLVMFGKVPYPGSIRKNWVPPLKASEYRQGTSFIPKLQIKNKIFMHAGSANFDSKHIEGHQADVLFMCLPGWKKVPEYTTTFLKKINPSVIVPFHFDDFSSPIPSNGIPRKLPFQDMRGFLDAIRSTLPDTEIRIPEYFQEMTFEA